MADLVDVIRTSVRAQMADQHATLRKIVSDLDTTALDWHPGPDTSSIGQLVAHAMETEIFLTRTSLDQTIARDRAAAFAVGETSSEHLAGLIDEAEREVDELLGTLTEASLAHDVTRTILAGPSTRTGLGWLLLAATHTREHIGHAALTRQMWEMQASSGNTRTQ